MTNIEKSAFRKGEYVGYGGGYVWKIKRGFKCWSGVTQCGKRSGYFATLREWNKLLANWS